MAARVPATSDSWPPPGALPPSSDAPRLRARCVAWPHRAPSAAPGVSGRADLAPEPGARRWPGRHLVEESGGK